MCVTWLAHLILLQLLTLILSGEVHKLWRSSLCTLLQPPAIFSPFGPNILLRTLFSNISLCSFLSLRNQVLHPRKIIAI
jgi:hypothetical protein